MKKIWLFLLFSFPATAGAAPLLTTLREARPFTAEEVVYLLPILLFVIGLFLFLDYWFIQKRKKP